MTSEVPRPTPADPMPATQAMPGVPTGMERDLPPELGPDAIGILQASTFMFSNAAGDIPPGSIGGLVGQLLWSGIVPPERARRVADLLMSQGFFSGWGVRTTATSERGYNPIGYHMGTVWPHDNSLIAHGLARYGFRSEANRIITAMLEAARFTYDRLPEAISGYDRNFGRMPVPYPTACNPQAWSSAAPLLFLRTILGLDAREGQLTADPDIPPEFGRILLTGTNAFGRRWDVEATRTQASIRLSSAAAAPAPSIA